MSTKREPWDPPFHSRRLLTIDRLEEMMRVAAEKISAPTDWAKRDGMYLVVQDSWGWPKAIDLPQPTTRRPSGHV